MIGLGVLFLGRKRPGFDPEWGAQMETAVRSALLESDYDVVIGDLHAVDDRTLRQAIAEFRKRAVHVLAVLQPTMGDGHLAPVLGQLWDDPVILWATPERQDYSMISSCSLVGVHVFASAMRQLGRPFEVVYGMPGDEDVNVQLDRAVRIAYAAARLKRGKVGIIGYHSPGYLGMHADPFLMSSALGLQLWHTGIQELVDRMSQLDADRVRADVESVLAAGMPLEDVDQSELDAASRYYLAMRDMIEEESLDSLALRDWPELPDLTGQWPYLAMVRFLTAGVSVACEGDMDGGINCLVGNLLGFGPGYLSDWLEHDRETITLWHAGNSSLNLCEPVGSPGGPRLARHFNNRKPMVVNADLTPDQPITIFRLWHCDNRYHLTSADAVTVKPRRSMMGSNGLARIDDRNVCDWFEELCHAGMPHHVAVFPGHRTDTLRRFARQVGLAWVA